MTGVQTCALPISTAWSKQKTALRSIENSDISSGQEVREAFVQAAPVWRVILIFTLFLKSSYMTIDPQGPFQYREAPFLYPLRQFFAVLRTERGKTAFIQSLTDFRGQLVVEIQIVQYRQTEGKSFLRLEEMPQVGP